MILDDTGREPGDARGADTPSGSSAAGGPAPEFDPQYDPAFQRGYQPKPGERAQTRVRDVVPETGTAPFRRTAAGDSAAAGTRTDTRPRPGADAVPVDPFASRADAAALDSLGGDVIEAETIATGEDLAAVAIVPTTLTVGSILERVEVSPRRNPYFLALWIIGGGFIVLGIVLYAVSVYTSYTSGSTYLDLTALVFSQVGWMLAGPLVTIGLATIVALVLLTALRSRPKPPVAEQE